MTTKEKESQKSLLTPEDMDQLNKPYHELLNNLDSLNKLKPVSVAEAKDSHDIVFNNNKKRWKLKD